jgi:hypothetical protein
VEIDIFDMIYPIKVRFRFSIIVAGAIALQGAIISPAQDLFIEGETGVIYEYSPNGTGKIFSGGSGDGELTFDHSGNLYVSGSDNTVYKYNPGGAISVFASGFMYPTGLAFGRSGSVTLFIADRFANRVYGYPLDTSDGSQAYTAGYAIDPIGLAIDQSGNVFAASEQDGTIVVYSIYGYTTFLASGQLSQPQGLAVDSATNVFVADQGTGCIYKIKEDGTMSTFDSGLLLPHGLAFDSAGNLYASDSNAGKIYKYTPDGTRTTFASGLFYPAGLAFQPIPTLRATRTTGHFRVAVSMPSPYYSTIVQSSSNLVNWVDIYTNVPPFTYSERLTATGPHFFRARLGP